jgi:hypothetical protein
MSGNVATLAGGAAGAFVGSFFGMPGLGFSIGSGLAGMAFAPKPKGNSVDPGDLSFDTSAYGKFQPWGYGTYLVQGPVTFWSTDYVAHKKTEKVGGKGGGAGKQKVETITYTRSFAVYLADCTNGTPIIGVRRIWDAISGQMLYDVGDGADAQTIIGSQQFAKAVRVYTGSLTQQPDALIEAHEGWAPAWRGHAYVVFEDWDHGGSKQAPVLAIEIVTEGAESLPATVETFTPAPLDVTWRMWSTVDGTLWWSQDEVGTMSGTDTGNVHWKHTTLDGSVIAEGTSEQTVGYPSANKHFDTAVLNYPYEQGLGFMRVSNPAITHFCRLTANAAVSLQLYTPDGRTLSELLGDTQPSLRQAWYYQGRIYAVTGSGDSSNGFPDSPYLLCWEASGSDYPPVQAIAMGDLSSYGGVSYRLYAVFANESGVYALGYDSVTPQARVFLLNADLTAVLADWTDPDFAKLLNRQAVIRVECGYLTTVARENIGGSLGYVVRVYRLPDGGGVASLLGSLTHGDPTSHPACSLAQGLLKVGSQAVSTCGVVGAAGTSLPSLVADLCARAGLTASDYDVSLLSSTLARLSVDRLRPARDWLTELGNIYRFRVRNSGGTLQFVPKGGSPVATIEQASLGLDVGEGIRPPITASRTQGIDLPRSVTVVYSDANADYAPGQQQYVMRQYSQGQDITLTVTAILTGAEALELAQIACKEPHLERLSWTTSVGIEHLSLEAGDVVDLPTGRAWVRDIQEQGDSILRATFVAEAAAAYTGNGLPAPATTAPARRIALAGPTRMELLDIPILQDTDNRPGIYLAALGYLSGWTGAEVYRSDDGEVFDPLASVVTAAVIGTTTNALVSGSTTIWDRANTLNVKLIDGSLSSASELNVLNGANAALVGAHGGWEIIQFETATLEADGTYTLSKLLRGRKGTEWAVGTHQAGDTFVALTGNTLGRVDKSINDIGVTRQYKAVSFGNDIAAAATIAFANQGVGLKPYAPAHVTGSRNGSGDLTIKWVRRTRVGGEWRDFVDASLGEDSEAYEVDIMSGSTVVRTLAVTSPAATYTAADQTTDFGSTQSSIILRIYQLSADIGRGYHTEVTL